MALLNFIKKDTYTTVEITNFTYVSNNRRITFLIKVFENDEKKDLIARFEKRIECEKFPQIPANCQILKSLDLSAHNLGDFGLISESLALNSPLYQTGSLVQYSKDCVVDDEGNLCDGWLVIGDIGKNQSLYDTKTDSLVMFDGESLVSNDYAVDEKKWNTFFSPEALSKTQSNIISNIYKYLKTLPEFKNTEDC